MMWSSTHLLFALSFFQIACAVPANVVTTSTRTTTITSCSCTSLSTSKSHTATTTITNSASCTSKKLKPTCKTTTSTIKSTITSSVKSTSSTKLSSSTKSSSSTKASTTSSISKTTSTSSSKSSTTTFSSSSSKSSTTTSKTSTKNSTTNTSTPTPTPNTGKRGLSYNTPSLTLPFSLSNTTSHVSWSYNWYSYPYTIGQPTSGYNPALAFAPMLWSSAPVLTSVWAANVAASISHFGTTAALAFNEPDGCNGGGSSCMNVSAAVAAYRQFMDPLAGKVRLGAPAVTNAVGAGVGLDWLAGFLAGCSGCTVDFVPVHWYGDGGDSAGFEAHVQQAYATGGGRPVWVTEFGVTSGAAEGFLESAMAWMDGTGWVERYAWFMDAEGNLVNAGGTGLSALGVIYDSGS